MCCSLRVYLLYWCASSSSTASPLLPSSSNNNGIPSVPFHSVPSLHTHHPRYQQHSLLAYSVNIPLVLLLLLLVTIPWPFMTNHHRILLQHSRRCEATKLDNIARRRTERPTRPVTSPAGRQFPFSVHCVRLSSGVSSPSSSARGPEYHHSEHHQADPTEYKFISFSGSARPTT